MKRMIIPTLAAFGLGVMLQSNLHAGPKGWLGVQVEEMTPSMRDEYELGKRFGLLVIDVSRMSPADKAGLQEDDVILSYDGNQVETIDALVDLVRETKPEKKVKIEFVRDGEQKSTEAEIGKFRRPGRSKHRIWHNMPNFTLPFSARARLGIKTGNLNKDLAAYFDLDKAKGALVLEVLEDSPAEEAGIKSGDVILKVENEEIPSPEELVDVLGDYKGGDKIALTVLRKGKTLELNAELEDTQAAYDLGNFDFNFSPEHGGRHYLKHGDGRKEIIIRKGTGSDADAI